MFQPYLWATANSQRPIPLLRDTEPLDSIRRVLVTRLRWLGDVVVSTPMLDTLREALPHASVEYLTYTSFAPVLQGHPACDRVITMPPKAGARATLSVVRQLRHPRIDWCFDSLANPRSAILVRLAAPRHSVGRDRGLRSWLYEYRQPDEPGVRSAVRHHLDLLTPLLGRVAPRPTRLLVAESERDDIAARLTLESDAELVLVHPGATIAERAWPLERWPDLINALQSRRRDVRVRVITQPGREDASDHIAHACRGDVAGLPVLELRELMALLTHASLYIGNDGGILHTAVALRVPTVGILGPAEKAAWFPYESWGPYRAVGEGGTPPGKRKKGPGEYRLAGVEDVLRTVEELLEMT